MRFMITGGAGYIGSHLLVDLLQSGHEVVVVDDFSTGHLEALRRVQALTGRAILLYQGDISDGTMMRKALRGVHTVFHLAASKSVGASVIHPGQYFRNNIGGMSSLLEAMEYVGVHRIVYSSTAAVYGLRRDGMPIHEDSPLLPASPYGLSKVQGEQQLDWMVRSHRWSAVSLRYFNPVGAHPSGQIGEHSLQPSNLVPRALKALTGGQPPLTVFGTDYDTPDGTAMRDYIHVCDLSRAHITALQALETPGHHIFNVGTGRGHSVREVMAAVARVTGERVPSIDGPRREGDIPVAVADPSRFRDTWGFQSRYSLDDMVTSAWRWTTLNPRGYRIKQRPVVAVRAPIQA